VKVKNTGYPKSQTTKVVVRERKQSSRDEFFLLLLNWGMKDDSLLA